MQRPPVSVQQRPSVLTGKALQNADALSQCSFPEDIDEPSHTFDVLLFDAFPGPPLTASTIPQMTENDPLPTHACTPLRKPAQQGLRGDDDDFGLYLQRVLELTISHECITWGNRGVFCVTACA